jgi:uncharacterized protein (DUF305 family)
MLTAVVAVSLAACGAARPTYQMGEAGGIARAKADSIRNPYTAADIAFMSGMISHHAQAIVMSKWAPTHGASPAVVRLTERIINAQGDEIKMMSTWLRDRHQPVPEPNPKGMKMMMNGTEHVMAMPGMLTDEQMAELDAARGESFDAKFLTYMIQHHRGAVAMVDALIANRTAAQDETVFKFAADVNTDQTTEVNRMLQMLLGFTPPHE